MAESIIKIEKQIRAKTGSAIIVLSSENVPG